MFQMIKVCSSTIPTALYAIRGAKNACQESARNAGNVKVNKMKNNVQNALKSVLTKTKIYREPV